VLDASFNCIHCRNAGERASGSVKRERERRASERERERERAREREREREREPGVERREECST